MSRFLSCCSVLFLVSILSASHVAAASTEGVRHFLKGFSAALMMPQGQWELSADYLVMNDTVDVLDVREDRLKSVSAAFQDPSVGDLNGVQLQLNYGLLPSSTLRLGYAYRDIELSFADFKVHSTDLAWRQALLQNPQTSFLLTLDGGLRFDKVQDRNFSDFEDIELLANRINPSFNVNISDIGSHFVFERNGLSVLTPRERGAPEIALEQMQDLTPYLRLSASMPVGRVLPSIFAEFGKSWVDSEISTNLGTLIPELTSSQFPLSENLDRDETYWKVGWGLSYAAPSGLTANLEYSYIQISREDSLDFIDDNHVLAAELGYFVTDSFAINLGGTYYRNLYNGVLPVLYNRFTQTGFDHDYGEAHAGVTFLFGN